MTVSHFRRSMLCLPASNAKALAKLAILECDATIYDLEDAVAPEMKAAARDALIGHFAAGAKPGVEHVIRINALSTPWGEADLEAVARCRPDAVLVPKVENVSDLAAVAARLDQAGLTETRLMAMIETPKGVLNAAVIAEAHAPRLAALIVGLNDLRKETKVPRGPDRHLLVPWLMQVVLAARAYGVAPIDSVSNDFRDLVAFETECAEGRAMGFDGKMLIHPAQIEPANRRFGPSEDEIAAARRIVAAFDAPEAAGQGAINIDGEMVERLHLEEARKLLVLVSS
ncbi:HpcH/HpaI aldolase/citrate lyase family protein [Rhizobium sp. C4]|uniref:HpcH/HpaI aldolase/citrate lyase family protein n=1 Tax=Rhizobium sp. C4 TaxID=1349800 RepID=UPI001E61A738|nr:CoA ester lyase [Rhizobium sp. C4]MCD2174813.1 CoA ester lyase [Rhizobium sp. C4]